MCGVVRVGSVCGAGYVVWVVCVVGGCVCVCVCTGELSFGNFAWGEPLSLIWWVGEGGRGGKGILKITI